MNRLRFISNATSIKKKIFFSFFVFLSVMWVYGSFSYYQSEKLMKEIEEIVDDEVGLLYGAHKLSESMDVRLASARAYILTGKMSYKESFDEYTKVSEQVRKDLEKHKEFEEIKQVTDAAEGWTKALQDNAFYFYQQGKLQEAANSVSNLDIVGDTIQEKYQVFVDNQNKRISDRTAALTRQMEKSKLILLVLTFLITLSVIIVIIFLSKDISVPITKVMERIEKISNGELNHKPLVPKSKDEIARLINATNEMNSQLRDIVMSIQAGAGIISKSGTNLKESVEQVTNEMEQTSAVTEEIAASTERQAQSSVQLKELMQIFVGSVNDASKRSLEIKDHSEIVNDMTDKGKNLIDDTERQIVKIDSIVKEAVGRVEGLNKKTAEITQLVKVITDIASQTNLLALNAAIEAARAGDAGKGFAVVADEVRKLAEQVSHSVLNISSIVSSIQEEVAVVTKSLVDGYGEVEKGSKQTAVSSETYRKISTAVTEMVSNIKTVAENLQTIKDSTGSIDQSVEDIASVSEEFSSSTKETYETINTVSMSVQDINKNAEKLNSTASNLKDIVAKFQY